MKRQILISSLIILFIQTFVSATTRYVPTMDYPTIQSAITAAVNGDVVVVAPGVYTGNGNWNLNFGVGPKAITVRSTINPANPDPAIIAATIIDCGGNQGQGTRRAFVFESRETSSSKVMGFTIRNGFAMGTRGADGMHYPYPRYEGDVYASFVPIPVPSGDDRITRAPYALSGSAATGDGFGGAILCSGGSSPTIQYCVITNCMVAGSYGGNGADGLSGTWQHFTLEDYDRNGVFVSGALPEPDDNGQWGGNGANGYGNGHGGAIACLDGSTPIISDCTISNNIARGGRGGDGGRGGNASGEPPDYDGFQGSGGDAGNSFGAGYGGGIYARKGSNPIIRNCTFINNIATSGTLALGGQRGMGNEILVTDGGPARDGSDGVISSGGAMAGGAAYYNYVSPSDANANFTNCTFSGNKAYGTVNGEDPTVYTTGGALYSSTKNDVNLINCTFTGNLGGAVYAGIQSKIDFNDCVFKNNSEINEGGAVYIGPKSSVNIKGCTFSGNSAYSNGGAIRCKSNAVFTNCSFGGNIANSDDSDNFLYAYGGAIYDFNSNTNLTADFIACVFAENQADYGGGFASYRVNANFNDCYFIGNLADQGGALDMQRGYLSVNGGIMMENQSTLGGGFNLMNVDSVEIRNSQFIDNSSSGVFPYGGDGGAINITSGASAPVIFNCLMSGNTASVDGGAIFISNASPNVGNCTFSDNSAGGYGGAIFSDFTSNPNITDCIFKGCNSHAIHEEDYGGNAVARYCLFYNNPDGEYYDSYFTGTGLVYTGEGQVGSIPGGAANLYGDPLFAAGTLGSFYLSQIDAGQFSNSPAVDNGSNTALSLGLNTFTTRINSIGDAGQVDRGYHYSDSNGIGFFQLTAIVTGGNGTIAPITGTYCDGAVVTLTAVASSGWRVHSWSGTNNDLSKSTYNTVIMNSNKTVGVKFDQPKTLIVAIGGGQQGYYSTIQDAIAAAEDGDTIIVYPGTYFGGYFTTSINVDKAITIRSLNPEDPCCVAATIIDGYRQSPYQEGYTNSGVEFEPSTDGNTIFNGFTIQNCGGYTGTGQNGQRDPQNHPNGYDGGWGVGAALVIYRGGGPVIMNCVIRDNVIIGGLGGNGSDATDDENAGRGGWGGFALGGAVYCGIDSRPTFINCKVIDNSAIGGSGGDGGNCGSLTAGLPNYGGNWSMRGTPEYPAGDIDPYSRDATNVTDSNLWQLWEWDGADYYYALLYRQFPPSYNYIGDYRYYSGYGGGVFCDDGSTVNFINCEISRNTAKGGMSGQGGTNFPVPRPFEPLIPYEIPSFGGGVYCSAQSSITFTGCTITNNVSSEPNEPPNNRIDPYLGHGGGICAEDTAVLVFNGCTFSGNDADAGGGIHFANANAEISDCNFTLNTAFHGGGVFGQHGLVTVLRSNFTYNIAASDVNEPNAGSGGGLHLFATEADIIDSNISGNQVEASGGGVFFSGENNSSFTNCLITNNTTLVDGGGISSNVFSSLEISNCTIADNTATGSESAASYGGGLYCSYNSYTNIIDSIFWDNSGQFGPQIAIGIDNYPSTIDVSYSDVKNGQSYVFVDDDCTLNWGAGNIHENPLFETGPMGYYYLGQIASGQVSNSSCVNTGSGPASSLGMNKYTTRIDEQPDRRIVDMGYHHPFSVGAEPCRFCELFRDGFINYKDFALLAIRWLNYGCSSGNDWCEHADITLDTYVDFEDIELFGQCWLMEDTEAPMPNPSEWQTLPYPMWSETHPNSINMVARTTLDSWDFWGGNVQYYFDCVYGDCDDSGWQDEPNYLNSNLAIGVEYGYRVRARDSSEQIPNDGTGQRGNKTEWSPIRYAIAGEEPPPPEDHNPPSPNPMTWGSVPTATSATSIAMAATLAVDDTAGVEYYFEDFDNPAVNSGWQSSPAWEDTLCEPETEYGYRVRARDTSPWNNLTGWSTVIYVTTPAQGEEPPPADNQPPAPVAWEVAPFETGGGLTAYANMTAAEAIDAGGNGVQYYFECVSIPSINSLWTTERVWDNVYIGRQYQNLYFHFRVRDNLGNTSAWSIALPCY